jgi:hypothetical protein
METQNKLNTNRQHSQVPGKPLSSDTNHNLVQSEYQKEISMLPGTTRPSFPKFHPCGPK